MLYIVYDQIGHTLAEPKSKPKTVLATDGPDFIQLVGFQSQSVIVSFRSYRVTMS